MKRALITAAIWLLTPSALALETIEASPYGGLLTELLTVVYAESVPCGDEATGFESVCFFSQAVGVEYLMERVTELAGEYEAAGLSKGEWLSSNGVWAVTLAFPNVKHGQLELFLLADATLKNVKGMVRLIPAR